MLRPKVKKCHSDHLMQGTWNHFCQPSWPLIACISYNDLLHNSKYMSDTDWMSVNEAFSFRDNKRCFTVFSSVTVKIIFFLQSCACGLNLAPFFLNNMGRHDVPLIHKKKTVLNAEKKTFLITPIKKYWIGLYVWYCVFVRIFCWSPHSGKR